MSTTTKPTIGNPFDGGMQFAEQAQLIPGPMQLQPATDRATAAIVTAQRVAIKRNLPVLLAEAKALAAAGGDKFYYSIPYKNRKLGTTTLVEGLSIGGTMAAVGCYGNCSVEAFPAQETQTHWTFMARFVDYEKGVTITRSFNQRKGQSTGMSDGARGEDMVFQIGQSKAMRNVVIAGLKWLTDEMFLAAKSGVLQRIEKSPDKAREWIVAQLGTREIAVARVERVIGRTAQHWSARDMARIFTELQALEDGFADADDLYPAAQTGEHGGEQQSPGDKRASSAEGGPDDAAIGQTVVGPAAGEIPATKQAPGNGSGANSQLYDEAWRERMATRIDRCESEDELFELSTSDEIRNAPKDIKAALVLAERKTLLRLAAAKQEAGELRFE